MKKRSFFKKSNIYDIIKDILALSLIPVYILSYKTGLLFYANIYMLIYIIAAVILLALSYRYEENKKEKEQSLDKKQ